MRPAEPARKPALSSVRLNMPWESMTIADGGCGGCWLDMLKFGSGRLPNLLKRKILQKSELGHGGGDGERVCREPNEVQGAPSAVSRLHWSCS